jgi:hydroxymethylglutaryl-CoA lyase
VPVDVHICETGTRDGLQNLPFVATEAKRALIDGFVAAGVPEIDAGSFVPPRVVPQFADVDEVVAHALSHRNVTIGALVPNPKGAERALAAGVHHIYFVISASESHNRANVRRTVAEQIEGFRAVRAAEADGRNRDCVRLLDRGRDHRASRGRAGARLCGGRRRRDRAR